MSSTNKTTNYELSQYVGSDKPTYLGDYNSDMLKIDTQMKTNATAAATADTKATTAGTNANTAITNAATADTKATNAQTTATSALNKATQNEADISKLNIVNFNTINQVNVSISGGTLTYFGVSNATNSDGSVGKLYGTIIATVTTNSTNLSISFPSNFRPTEKIYINGTNLAFFFNSLGFSNIGAETLAIDTDGTVSFSSYVTGMTSVRYDLLACLLFLKNFGDTSN